MSVPVDFQRVFHDFSRGLNTDGSTYTMDDTESPDLENIRINPVGPISGRFGQTMFGGRWAATNGIKSLWRLYRQDGTHKLLYTYAAILSKVNATDLSIETSTTLKTFDETSYPEEEPENVAWEFATFKDWAFFVTQAGIMFRTNGTDVEAVGIQPDDDLDFTEPSGSTHAQNTYMHYVWTWTTRDGLGDSPTSVLQGETAGPPSHGTTHKVVAANADITVTVPSSGRSSGDVVAINLYRQITTGAAATPTGPYYLVARDTSPADDGTDAIIDNVTDANLGVKVDITRIEPLRAGFICVHQNRLWIGKLKARGATPTNYYWDVMFSDAGFPEQWPAEFRLTFPNDEGETLTGMTSFNNQLLVTTMNRINSVVGTGIERGPALIPDYRTAELAKGPGAMSHRVIQKREGAVYMMNKRDMWRIDGQGVKPLSRFRSRNWIRDNLAPATVSTAVGVATDTDYRVTFRPITGDAWNSVTLIYDTQGDAFLVDRGYGVNSYCYIEGEGDTPQLWAGSAAVNSASLLKMDLGNQDVDPALATPVYVDITRYFRTKDFMAREFGDTMQPMILLVDTKATGTGLAVSMFVDKESEIALRTIVPDEGSTVWAAFKWAEAPWSVNAGSIHRLSLPQAAVGERAGFKFVQSGNEEPFQIDMLAFGGQIIGIRSAP